LNTGGIVNNAALLLALSLIYEIFHNIPQTTENAVREILTGIVIGVIGIAIMMNPWMFMPGVVFDTRSVLLSISGLFLGTVPTLLAMFMTGGFRLYLSGAGQWTGVAVIITSGGIGLVWRYLWHNKELDISTRELYLFGIVVHIAMLLWMFSLPWPVAKGVLSKISLPVLLIFPVTTALLGWLMINRGSRKRAEEALRQSEADLKESQRTAHVGSWRLDLVSNHVVWSEELYRMYGFDPTSPPPPYTEHQKLFTPESWKKLSTALNNTKDTGIPYELELETLREDGNRGWMWVHGEVVRDARGAIVGLRGAAQDITERKQMEEQLRQSQKMESIGILAGGIAHDFNNIMGIILGNTELALEDVPESNPTHTNLEEIRKASLRAASIVKQLLSFTRITDQKLQPIEIAPVIKDALKFLRSTIPATIDIEQDICVTDETILADPTQINQIMMNLCINASYAMEQTGGKLTITVENVLLGNSLAKDYPDLKSGKYVKIAVSDTGPGIDSKIIDRIFEPYFTTKEIGKGSGMGLAVVHGIVKSHSGSIKVDSTLGKGTQFSILFPLAQGKAAVEAETIQEIPRGSETILFVDDEISIVNMVKRMFERLGYKVQTATTPQDALDRFALNPDHFDLVITDMTMPQMTGVKLSEKLMEIRPDIPIIVCTGHSALVDEEKAKELGLAAYIMKPISIRETAQTIRKVLDRK